MRSLLSIFLILFLSCDKGVTEKETPVPNNYKEMFTALKIDFNTTYSYTELINNKVTGNKGTIKFSLIDTSFTEDFNSAITKDQFRLDSFKTYTCTFKNLGINRYPSNQSVLINNARRTLSFVNGRTMISFDSITNGSYYYYQYIIKE
jgi:hypothetical protein